MSYEDRPVSEGPARDDPELGDTLAPQTSPPPPGREQAGEVAGTARERAGEVTGAARERAGEVTGAARERAGEVTTTARDEARGVAREAESQARRLAHDARDELRSQADTQVGRLADGLDDLTRQLRSMGERGEPGPATDLVRQAAGQTERLADHLRRGGVDDALGQVRDLGRNRPGLFLLGAFGLGLVGGRLARNLAQEPGNGSGSGSGPGGGRQPGREVGASTGGGEAFTAMPSGDSYAVPAGGHAAYGAPVRDEWGG